MKPQEQIITDTVEACAKVVNATSARWLRESVLPKLLREASEEEARFMASAEDWESGKLGQSHEHCRAADQASSDAVQDALGLPRLSMSMFANRADYDAAVKARKEPQAPVTDERK